MVKPIYLPIILDKIGADIPFSAYSDNLLAINYCSFTHKAAIQLIYPYTNIAPVTEPVMK